MLADDERIGPAESDEQLGAAEELLRVIVLETLRTPEAMDNLRALRFTDVEGAHHSVAVRPETAVQMIAAHGGAYAAEILAQLGGKGVPSAPSPPSAPLIPTDFTL